VVAYRGFLFDGSREEKKKEVLIVREGIVPVSPSTKVDNKHLSRESATAEKTTCHKDRETTSLNGTLHISWGGGGGGGGVEFVGWGCDVFLAG